MGSFYLPDESLSCVLLRRFSFCRPSTFDSWASIECSWWRALGAGADQSEHDYLDRRSTDSRSTLLKLFGASLPSSPCCSSLLKIWSSVAGAVSSAQAWWSRTPVWSWGRKRSKASPCWPSRRPPPSPGWEGRGGIPLSLVHKEKVDNIAVSVL